MKEVTVFRIYEGRPAKITVLAPDVPEGVTVEMELTKENVMAIEYLDDTFKKAFDPKVQRRIMSEISGVDVVRLPRKEKKELKKSVGIANGVNKVRLIRKSVIKTVSGYEMQIRRQNAKNK